MKKRILACCLVSVLSVSLAGCSYSDIYNLFLNEKGETKEAYTETDEDEEEEIKENVKEEKEETPSEEKETKENDEDIVEENTLPEEQGIPVDNNKAAYKAYYDFLSQNKDLNVEKFDTPMKSISICDCYGDEYPELIYSSYAYKDEYMESFCLNIATFDGEKVVILNENNLGFDGPVEGGNHIRLFNIGDEKKIYGVYDYLSADGTNELFVLNESNDKTLQIATLSICQKIPVDEFISDFTFDYYYKFNNMSKSDFENEINNILKDIRIIYQCDYYPSEMPDPFKIDSKITSSEDLYTYNEALTFLNKKISE